MMGVIIRKKKVPFKANKSVKDVAWEYLIKLQIHKHTYIHTQIIINKNESWNKIFKPF